MELSLRQVPQAQMEYNPTQIQSDCVKKGRESCGGTKGNMIQNSKEKTKLTRLTISISLCGIDNSFLPQDLQAQICPASAQAWPWFLAEAST